MGGTHELGTSLNVPSPYLLLKAVRGQEEAVQGHKVALQEPHEQHQVHPICKLQGEGQVKALRPRAPRQAPSWGLVSRHVSAPKATSPGRLLARAEEQWPAWFALQQTRPMSGWSHTGATAHSPGFSDPACIEH